ncbi:MAG: hypothetical protein OQL20_09430 [Sedimenticola sp.]|nr:hypothetical protein [Sedimenticola sp.]
MKESTIKILDSAAILACVTAFLYSASTAFTHGYFALLNLDSDILDRNFHQIIYHGMILNIWTILTVPFIWAVFVTIHSAYKIELSNYLFKSFSNGRKFVGLKKKLKLSTKKHRAFERKYRTRNNNAWVILFVSVIFLLTMVKYESQGKEEARQLLLKIEKGEFNKINLKSQKMGNGFAYLYCGARNCAALDVGNKEVIYFPQNGHRYISQTKM